MTVSNSNCQSPNLLKETLPHESHELITRENRNELKKNEKEEAEKKVFIEDVRNLFTIILIDLL